MKKKPIVIVVLVGLLFSWYSYLSPSLNVATGYTSKYVCSYNFLSDIESNNIDKALNFFPINLVRYSIDTENKTIESSFFGFIAKTTATYYNDGKHCGCVLGEEAPNRNLLDEDPSATLRSGKRNSLTTSDSLPWPRGNRLPDSLPPYVDQFKLNQTLDSVLKANSGIYAIVISYKNLLITEKYQTGVNKNSRLLGWSMTKTIGNALFGILENNKLININATTGISEWQKDERKNITINNLLQMSSGLEWSENYAILSKVTRMLYLEKDLPAFAQKSLAKAIPNKKWKYSSGSSNILSKILRSKFNNYNEYRSFPYDSLFNKINMTSALIEFDNFGNYILSSYGWATARDWTKFGLLYLNKGNWFGDQIFSSDWVNYSTTPVSASNGVYGSQIWLNHSGKWLPSVPRDAYFESGYGGQRILVIPSKNMVITVMSGHENGFNFDAFYSKIFECFAITNVSYNIRL